MNDLVTRYQPLCPWDFPCAHAEIAIQRLRVIFSNRDTSLISLSQNAAGGDIRLLPSGALHFCFHHTGHLAAKAIPTNTHDVILISCGLIRLLKALSIAICTDHRMRSLLNGRPELDASWRDSDTIPRGFEFTAPIDGEVIDPTIEAVAFTEWYGDSLRLLDADHRIKELCARTYHTAIQWLFLHESAHALLGHTAVGATRPSDELNAFWDAAQLDAGPEDAAFALSDADYRAFELEADVYAIERLLRQGIAERPATTAVTDRVYARTLGCLLCPLVFHVYGELRNLPNQHRRHPPLWFRSALVLKILDRILIDPAFALGDTHDRILLRRHASMLIQTVSGIHPTYESLFGMAVSAGVNDVVDQHIKQLMSESRQTLALAATKRRRI